MGASQTIESNIAIECNTLDGKKNLCYFTAFEMTLSVHNKINLSRDSAFPGQFLDFRRSFLRGRKIIRRWRPFTFDNTKVYNRHPYFFFSCLINVL